MGGLCAGVYLSVGSRGKYPTIFEKDPTILELKYINGYKNQVFISMVPLLLALVWFRAYLT